MAYWVQLMAKLGPQIIPGRPRTTAHLVDMMTRDTGQSKGEVFQGIMNLIESLIWFLCEGSSVHIEGLGTFTVEIDGKSGRFSLHFRPVPRLLRRIQSEFRGEIKNKENIGKLREEMAALWNSDPETASDPYTPS